MRCPDCNKFVSLEFEEPEVSDEECEISLDEKEGNLEMIASADVRIVRSCADCSQELKEANLNPSDEGTALSVDLLDEHVERVKGKWRWKNGHGIAEISDPEIDQIEEGGGRYAKSYFGVHIKWTVSCVCGEDLCDVEIEDKIAASGMDELV